MAAEVIGLGASTARSIEVVEKPPAWMCLQCRGAKLLCGKPRCPIIVKAQSMGRVGDAPYSDLISGSSPPGVFVGRIGLPQGLDRADGPSPVRGHHHPGHARAVAREAARDDNRLPVLARKGEHESQSGGCGEARFDPAEAPGALDGGAARRHRAEALKGPEEGADAERGHPALRAVGAHGEVQDVEHLGGAGGSRRPTTTGT